ncbi:Cytochrome C oxidase, cbb3-type, subunit III [Bryocella elongata]|uniref:Cytochrome C oxidase, cbb3-type, subunit III n=1 Tax=Bryocella elongata TaxID=863522 RepID=A0A1H6B097_9BACT|nr:c-type cytochrome [Bryocella elongata]SEG54258.1 Cytochrome C oxidase, cbb3-type, subunit III [Bryocella elongata]
MGQRSWIFTVLMALMVSVSLFDAPAQTERPPGPRIPLHRTRLHRDDLEIGGDLVGVLTGQSRFVNYTDLLALPQVSVRVSGDTNFVGPVRIEGVLLESLPALLGARPDARLVTAICDDFYEAHYPIAYQQAHHPILVLKVNGLDPLHWPLGSDKVPMGPYMISHAHFQSKMQVLSHREEPQIPWGVVRLDFENEAAVYRPILPIGPDAQSLQVQQGYAIARENCFRCHNREGQGGTKAKRSWSVVARRAITDPQWFATYVRAPNKINPATQMSGSPQYDDATIAALIAYFKPFAHAD